MDTCQATFGISMFQPGSRCNFHPKFQCKFVRLSIHSLSQPLASAHYSKPDRLMLKHHQKVVGLLSNDVTTAVDFIPCKTRHLIMHFTHAMRTLTRRNNKPQIQIGVRSKSNAAKMNRTYIPQPGWTKWDETGCKHVGYEYRPSNECNWELAVGDPKPAQNFRFFHPCLQAKVKMIYVCATIKFNSKIVDHPMPTKHSLCRKSMSQGIFSSETRDLRAANVSAHFAHARKVTGNPWIDGWPKESKMVMGNLVSNSFAHCRQIPILNFHMFAAQVWVKFAIIYRPHVSISWIFMYISLDVLIRAQN